MKSKIEAILNLPEKEFRVLLARMAKGVPMKKLIKIPNSVVSIDKAIAILDGMIK